MSEAEFWKLVSVLSALGYAFKGAFIDDNLIDKSISMIGLLLMVVYSLVIGGRR